MVAEYPRGEVRPGFVILDKSIVSKIDRVFVVERVLYRRGRGLIFTGHYEDDGYSGQVLPVEGRMVRAIGGDENLSEVPWAVTSDFPWAEEVT